MRIVSGSHKGRKIHPPAGLPVRPTTDMAKEGLFNILNTFLEFSELTVFDLFAGTGNITFEFASRSCIDIIAVDNNSKCTAFMSKTAADLGFKNITVIRSDVFSFLFKSKRKADLVFADPPYDLPYRHELPDRVLLSSVKEEGWFILEHVPSDDFTKHPSYHHTRTYGKVHFSFFQNNTGNNLG